MILTCPSCKAQYLVQKGQIPPDGRKVKCRNCQYTWLQAPKEDVTPEVIDESEENTTAEVAETSKDTQDAPQDASQDVQSDDQTEETRISLEEAEARAEKKSDDQSDEATDESTEQVDTEEKADNTEASDASDDEGTQEAETSQQADDTGASEDTDDFEVNDEYSRSFDDDVSEVYSNSISAEIYDDVPRISILPFISGVIICLGVLLAGVLGVKHYTNTQIKPIDQLSAIVLGHAQTQRSPLEMNEVTARYDNGSVIIQGRIDNVSKDNQALPEYTATALKRGQTLGLYRVDLGKESVSSGGSVAINTQIDGMPSQADAIRLDTE